jgi:hypothetical protein
MATLPNSPVELTDNAPSINAPQSEWDAWRNTMGLQLDKDIAYGQANKSPSQPITEKGINNILNNSLAKLSLITDKNGNRLISDELITASIKGDSKSKQQANSERTKILNAWAKDILANGGYIDPFTGKQRSFTPNDFGYSSAFNSIIGRVLYGDSNPKKLSSYLNKIGRPIQPVGGDIPITPLATKSIAELDTAPISALNTAPIGALNTAPIGALNTAPIKKIDAPAPSFLTLNDLQKQNYVTNTDFTNSLNSQNNVILGNQTVPSSQNTQLLNNLTNRNQQLGTSISSGMQSQNKNLATNTNTGLMNSFKNFQIPTAQQNGVNLGNYNDNRNTATDTWWSNYIATRR